LNWFTSDLHINHERIIEYCSRPFGSVEEMNEALVTRWNDRVGYGDTVYVVGDMFLGKPEDAAPLIKRLRGHKVLIHGNHDRSRRTMLECGFNETWQRKDLKLRDGRRALLSHKPLPESTIENYDLQIHGHRHSLPVVSGKRLNVCVDLWNYAPISEDEICAVELGPVGFDQVTTSLTGDMVEVRALVRREDMDGLLDHLYVFSRTIWDTSKKE
jgi:calcineurin-like phosphoesterase family protein